MNARLLTRLIRADAERMRLLALVRALDLPDCWIGAGFVRNAVWDHLHGRAPRVPDGDIDIIWFDPLRTGPATDEGIEHALRALDAAIDWSVKNQARMHAGNGDQRYASAEDAMRYWPETATAVAVRLDAGGLLEIAAPFGLDDLFAGVIRPTPGFVERKRAVFDARWQAKRWLVRWPRLRLQAAERPTFSH